MEKQSGVENKLALRFSQGGSDLVMRTGIGRLRYYGICRLKSFWILSRQNLQAEKWQGLH